MTSKRTMLFLLALSSTEALVLALSSAAVVAHLGLSDLLIEALLLTAIVAVTCVLWLGVQPAPDRRLFLGAFVVPIVVVAALLPFVAVLVFPFHRLSDMRGWIAVLCIAGVAVSAAALRGSMRRWRLATCLAMSFCGLLVLVPAFTPLLTDGGFTTGFDLDMAAVFGLLGGLVVGIWAAAAHPLVASVIRAGRERAALRRPGSSRWRIAAVFAAWVVLSLLYVMFEASATGIGMDLMDVSGGPGVGPAFQPQILLLYWPFLALAAFLAWRSVERGLAGFARYLAVVWGGSFVAAVIWEQLGWWRGDPNSIAGHELLVEVESGGMWLFKQVDDASLSWQFNIVSGLLVFCALYLVIAGLHTLIERRRARC